MSRENVEAVRTALEAFNTQGLASIPEYWHPEIEWHTDPLVPEPGVYKGFDAVRTYLEGFLRASGEMSINTAGGMRLSIQELVDVGEDEVLSLLTVSGPPRGQTDQQTQFLNWAQIMSVRDGKIVRVRSFLDEDRALEAAGLAGEGSPPDQASDAG
jgi:ketosteroid isomerase-like protein